MSQRQKLANRVRIGMAGVRSRARRTLRSLETQVFGAPETEAPAAKTPVTKAPAIKAPEPKPAAPANPAPPQMPTSTPANPPTTPTQDRDH